MNAKETKPQLNPEHVTVLQSFFSLLKQVGQNKMKSENSAVICSSWPVIRALFCFIFVLIWLPIVLDYCLNMCSAGFDAAYLLCSKSIISVVEWTFKVAEHTNTRIKCLRAVPDDLFFFIFNSKQGTLEWLQVRSTWLVLFFFVILKFFWHCDVSLRDSQE